jgi:branched-chain amino acid transport system ATP-binding protein
LDPCVLALSDVTVRYGGFLALDRISLEVGRGEIVGLIGPNGAGKSSVLRAIAGLVRPASGRIELDGRSLEDVPVHHRVSLGLAVVPEGRGLFPHMSVEENLLMGAYAVNDRMRRAAGLERALALFPALKDRLGQFAGTLSGGQQQMLAIAVGLMSEPMVCLFDEPSMGLAPIVIGEIAEGLHRLREAGLTVLLAEQNAKVASDVAARIYILQNGRIRFHDTPANLLKNPEVVEGYLGVY